MRTFILETTLCILLFIIIALVSLHLTIKNWKNKSVIKKIFAIISTVILFVVALLNAFVQGRCFFVSCDGFAEGMLLVLIIIPSMTIIILPWIAYWLIKRFS